MWIPCYSGFLYDSSACPVIYILNFAVSRIAGWCAHRIEELTTCRRIIRPAYRSITHNQGYIPLEKGVNFCTILERKLSDLKIKTAWFILIGCIGCETFLFIYQMLFLVDPETGFFTDQNIVAICLAVFMVIVSAIIMFMCFYDKMPQKDLNQSKIFRL